MSGLRVSLAEGLGAVALLAVPLGLCLPILREMQPYGPKVMALLAGNLGIILFGTQYLYWMFLVPILRRRRHGRKNDGSKGCR